MAFKCDIYGRVFSRPSNVKVIFKNCTPFEKCITEINNTQDNTLDFDFVMVKYRLLKYGDNYLKTYASLHQPCRDEPVLHNSNAIVDFTNDNVTD